MKIDAFTHIFPKAYWDRMLRALPDGRDMHKRVRAIPSIVELDARFRTMDGFGDDYRPGGYPSSYRGAREDTVLMETPAAADTVLVLPDGVHVDVLA